MQSLLLLLLISCRYAFVARAYSRPECDSWPDSQQWSDLKASLDGQLYGPFNGMNDYAKQCIFTSQGNVEFLAQGQGLCMHKHRCVNSYCEDTQRINLPEYSIEVKSISDLQKALAFANQHDIQVVVKSSGHSYQGQSTVADSLLLWMRHFPMTNTVHSFTDSCGNEAETIQVAGGENFDDVMNVVRSTRHVVTGYCQTVVLGGGWLLGGGMSYTARKYGFGVDNVVSFEVVLANGTLVQADECQNHDLFWALRGGGPGFGVITKVEYKVLPVTKITNLRFEYSPPSNPNILQSAVDWIGDFFGLDSIWALVFGVDTTKATEFTRSWMRFLVETIPGLEREWGGNIDALEANFRYSGSLVDAKQSSFIQKLDMWYDANHPSLQFNFPRFSDQLVEYDSWHEYNGGTEAYRNPDFDGSGSAKTSEEGESFSRVIPEQVFIDKPEELITMISDLFINKDITTHANYVMGGAPNDVDELATALHPNMRRGLLEVEMSTRSGAEKLRQFLAGYDTSVCYNHHSAEEPNWRNECWGSNYERLLEIKEKYDPDRRFNIYHGVGKCLKIEKALSLYLNRLVSHFAVYRCRLQGTRVS